MRTDMKVGIVVGLGIALVVVIWIFAVNREEAKPEAPAAGPEVAVDNRTARPPAETPGGDGEGAVRISDIIVEGGPVRREPPAAIPVEPSVVEIARDDREPEPILPPLPALEPLEPVVPPAARRDLPPLPALEIEPLPLAVVSPVAAAPLVPADTYTVVEGDLGFWGVAQKVYGDGSKYTLIRDANPDVDSNRLRVGQKLKIPPLPRTEPTVARVTPAAAPPAAVAADEYVVQDGDLGFWGVAKKVYGDGSKWPLIRNANPNVDPRRLRIGMRLKVPPLSEADRVAVSSSAPAAETPRAPAAPDVPSDGRPRFYDVVAPES